MAVYVSSAHDVNNHTSATSWELDREENLIVKQEEAVQAIYRRGYWDYAVLVETTNEGQ